MASFNPGFSPAGVWSLQDRKRKQPEGSGNDGFKKIRSAAGTEPAATDHATFSTATGANPGESIRPAALKRPPIQRSNACEDLSALLKQLKIDKNDKKA